MLTQSGKNMTFLNLILDSSWMIFAWQDASTAAWSSRHGMVNCFSGDTLDLAVMSLTSYMSYPSSLSDIRCRLWRLIVKCQKTCTVLLAQWRQLLTGLSGKTHDRVPIFLGTVSSTDLELWAVAPHPSQFLIATGVEYQSLLWSGMQRRAR